MVKYYKRQSQKEENMTATVKGIFKGGNVYCLNQLYKMLSLKTAKERHILRAVVERGKAEGWLLHIGRAKYKGI